MAFLLLILAHAVYFIRPAEWVPNMQGVPLFQYILVATMITSASRLMEELSWQSISRSAIAVGVVGLLVVCIASEAVNDGSIVRGVELGKAVLLYFLILAVIDTPSRFKRFLKALAAVVALNATLLAMSFHGLGGLQASVVTEHKRDGTVLHRLEGLGGANFDPNDTAMLKIIGVVISLHLLFSSRSLWKPLWSASLIICVYALYLTQSRGGLIALMAACATYVVLRWNTRVAVTLSLIALPLLLRFADGRMTEFNAIQQGTGQARIQLWTSGLSLFTQNPLLGVGPGGFERRVGKACHNSFLQAFGELGFFGGACLLGAFSCATYGSYLMCREPAGESPVQHEGLPYCIAALIVGYAVALLALNHIYAVHTFLVLALPSLAMRFFGSPRIAARLMFDDRMLLRLGIVSALFVVGTHVGVRVLVRW